jgi:hypothetical protein
MRCDSIVQRYELALTLVQVRALYEAAISKASWNLRKSMQSVFASVESVFAFSIYSNGSILMIDAP